jgi:murein DD-endopeptidase MepM/ murein hydrolase activator NlpD
MKRIWFPLIMIVLYIMISPRTFGEKLSQPFFGEYRHQQRTPCLTEEKRQEIKAMLSQSIQELTRQGILPKEAVKSMVSLGWPLQAASNLSDYGYHGVSGFVDHDGAFPNQLMDYNCGTRTYDLSSGYNHKGTDYFTWPFSWYKMDNDQVEVIAAAAGVIIGKSDGNYDRNCDSPDSNWNAVYIRHSDNSKAWYGHLKNGSLTSKTVGQSVSKGEYLGIVGSSGRSTGPHLHFELYDSANNLVDPYYGSCNTSASGWDVQPSYYDSAINALMTHWAPPVFPSCPQTETLNTRDSFRPGDTVYFAAYYRDQLAGQISHYYVIRPDQSVYYDWTHSSPYPYHDHPWWYWYMTLPVGSPTGTWTFRVIYEGNIYEHYFEMIDDSITVITPNGGENWEVGSSHNITWASSGSVGNVKIEYSTNSGGSWSNITSSTTNDGSYSWTIPNTPSTQCMVRISETDGTPTDTSNSTFTIGPAANLLWTRDGSAHLWKFNSNGNWAGAIGFEYSSGWTATTFQRNSDGSAQLLWTRDGSAHLWKFNANGGWAGAIGFGYASGWTATSYQRNSDGSAQLLWSRDGSAHLWKFNASGGWAGAIGYGYSAGWTATTYQRNSDGSAQLLWTRDGSAHLWRFNASGGWAGATGYGYSSGWTATTYQRNSDGSAQLLWTRNGSAHLWKFNSSGGWAGATGFGYAGWIATSYQNCTNGLTAALQTFDIMLNHAPDWTGTSYHSRISGRDSLLETTDIMINYTDYAKDFPVEVVQNPGDTVNEVNFAQQIQDIDFGMYKPEVPYIIIRKAGTGGGTIIANGLRCGNKCMELIIPYGKSAVKTLRVVPDPGSCFVRWDTSQGITLEDIRDVQPGDMVIAVFNKR